jgi:nitroreductase
MSEIIDKINLRYATKKFNPEKKINKKDFEELLEALRLSPSSYGLQPWKFIVVEDKEIRAKIRAAAHGQEQVTDASHLIVLCAKKSITEEDINHYIKITAVTRGINVKDLDGFKKRILEVIKRKDISEWNRRQVYLALGFLINVCAMKKIDSCPMEGFDYNEVDEILRLDKEGLNVAALCPVGYRADDDKYSKLKKVRFSEKEVIEFR